LLLGVAGVVGCDAILGIQDHAVSPSPDGGGSGSGSGSSGGGSGSGSSSGTDAGHVGDGSDDANADDGATDAPTCSGPTLYVSQTTGSDSNPGCDSAAPKQTIGTALIAGRASGTAKTIKVCKGTYQEGPLTLDFAASLLGSYDCATWQRTTSYGSPTFDGANLTTIIDGHPDAVGLSAAGRTLQLAGSAIDSTVLVDGFNILGATSGSLPSGSGTVALACANSASPTLSNNQITGGSLTASSAVGSAGVWIMTGANPTIENNEISGGSGANSSAGNYGSMAIYTDGTSTSVQIIGNVITGGTGSSPGDGSSAMHLDGTVTPGPAYVVRSNVISAGSGTSTAAAAVTGVYVSGNSNVTLDENSIDGSSGSTGTSCGYGVAVYGASALSITGNRIYGGNCSIPVTSVPLGLLIENVQSPVVYNNMIHGGTSTSGGTAAALQLSRVDGADVRHNTLIAPTSAATSATALWVESNTTNLSFVNNILAGSGQNWGVFVSACADGGVPAIAAFENNFIFGTQLGLFHWSTCLGSSFSTIDGMTASLLASEPGATVQGNVTIAASCTTADGGTDSGCVVSAGCTSANQACLTTLFSGWDTTSYGYKNLFPPTLFAGTCPFVSPPPAGNGWTLAASPPPPCRVTKSSVDDRSNSGLNVDLYGNCRSSTPSMGAEEDSAAVCE
jgi:hypothetical protein